mmetsp:Transcript_49962/g.142978  ORF Transcript_49962/g.142978 Transcript_49962/m.142978 type:complete len:211 (+) Transcript_49962:597-1229(+)
MLREDSSRSLQRALERRDKHPRWGRHVPRRCQLLDLLPRFQGLAVAGLGELGVRLVRVMQHCLARHLQHSGVLLAASPVAQGLGLGGRALLRGLLQHVVDSLAVAYEVDYLRDRCRRGLFLQLRNAVGLLKLSVDDLLAQGKLPAEERPEQQAEEAFQGRAEAVAQARARLARPREAGRGVLGHHGRLAVHCSPGCRSWMESPGAARLLT